MRKSLLILTIMSLLTARAYAELKTNQSADVVVGQTDFTTATSGTTQDKLYAPTCVYSDGKRLFIAERYNHRLLIYNTIPTTNGASADVVIGQPDFTTATSGSTAQDKFNWPYGLSSDGKRLFIADEWNHRIMIYNTIPTANGASADVVIGQPDFTTATSGTTQSKLKNPYGVFTDGKRLFIAEQNNHRVLIFNIGGSSIELGPQFDQGKAVLGKVFNDPDANGRQDDGEKGIEGVKIVSDSGIFAITDSDGKYHFPYIETGQRLLKIDPVTLAEGSIITTDSPYKITVTKGILSKVSFGVKLPEPFNAPEETSGPLLKVSVTQDPLLLKPKLSVAAILEEGRINFTIDCNYHLFIEKASLKFYNQDYQLIKTVDFIKPLPAKFTLPASELPKAASYYYQLSVYDKQDNEDRTAVAALMLQ